MERHVPREDGDVAAPISLEPFVGGAWDPVSDEELVERILEGDVALFEVLRHRYNQRLTGLLGRSYGVIVRPKT
jgi:hypothetical protein